MCGMCASGFWAALNLVCNLVYYLRAVHIASQPFVPTPAENVPVFSMSSVKPLTSREERRVQSSEISKLMSGIAMLKLRNGHAPM